MIQRFNKNGTIEATEFIEGSASFYLNKDGSIACQEFIEGNNNLTRKEILLGKNHIDTSLYNEYLDYLRNKYLNIKEYSKDKNVKIDEMLEYINEQTLEIVFFY